MSRVAAGLGMPDRQQKQTMSDDSRRPILVLLTSHWVSMLGVALVTTAGFSWLFVLPVQLRGHTSNPYIGIVVFLIIPIIFIFGLVLIALGVFLGAATRCKRRAGVAGNRRPASRAFGSLQFLRCNHCSRTS